MNRLVKRIAIAIRKHNRYNRTVRELSWLSDRELSDLGITRCDIPRIANQAVNNRDVRI